jgi:hypothetical protein
MIFWGLRCVIGDEQWFIGGVVINQEVLLWKMLLLLSPSEIKSWSVKINVFSSNFESNLLSVMNTPK